jgi:hypothetical protein
MLRIKIFSFFKKRKILKFSPQVDISIFVRNASAAVASASAAATSRMNGIYLFSSLKNICVHILCEYFCKIVEYHFFSYR